MSSFFPGLDHVVDHNYVKILCAIIKPCLGFCVNKQNRRFPVSFFFPAHLHVSVS